MFMLGSVFHLLFHGIVNVALLISILVTSIIWNNKRKKQIKKLKNDIDHIDKTVNTTAGLVVKLADQNLD